MCPCGSNFNVNICCEFDDCRYRNNWNEETNTGNNTTSRIRSNNLVVNRTKIGQAILPTQQVKVHGNFNKNVVALFDNCSQNSFIKEKTAKKLQLKGDKISFILVTTDGNRSKMSGTLYEMEIMDTRGKVHQIQVIGMKELSTRYSGFKIIDIQKRVKKIKTCNGLAEDKLARKSSDIDVLIGSDLASLHPQFVTNIGDLVILKSQFGTGWCVMGHNAEHVRFTSNNMGTRANFAGVEEINFGPSSQPEPETKYHVAATTHQEFSEIVSVDNSPNLMSLTWSYLKSTFTLVIIQLLNLVISNSPDDHDNTEGHEGTSDDFNDDEGDDSEERNDEQKAERILPITSSGRKRNKKKFYQNSS